MDVSNLHLLDFENMNFVLIVAAPRLFLDYILLQ